MQISISAELNEGYGARLAFSRDGAQWVSASPQALHLWEGTSRAASVPFDGVAACGAHFSADGRRVFVAPHIFDVATRAIEPLPPLEPALVAALPADAHAQPEEFGLLGAAWSEDGAHLAVCSRHRAPRRRGAVSAYRGPEQRVLLLDGPTRALRHVLWEGGLADEYRTLAFGAGVLAVGWRDIQLWNAADGSALGELHGHAMAVRDLRFSPDGAQMLSADWEGRVIVWDVAGRAQRLAWRAHKGAAQCAVFHPDAARVATGGDDGMLRVFQVDGARAEPLAALKLGGSVEGIAFRPDGAQLIAAVNDGRLVVCAVTG